MEKNFTIPSVDGFEIKGILNYREKSDRIIIFVHGFTGSTNEAHYVQARDYFTQKGFATFRFSLYHGASGCRKLHDSSIRDHSIDTQKVIDFLKKSYKNIFLVGHSLGGPSIVGVTDLTVVNKIILWDPAFDLKSSAKKIFLDNGRYYTSSGSGKNIQVSELMLKEFRENDYFQVLENISFEINDMRIIYASEDRHVNLQPKIDKLGIKNHTIAGADHCFTREGDLDKLFEKTLDFIEG